jgi:hypothetical protein
MTAPHISHPFVALPPHYQPLAPTFILMRPPECIISDEILFGRLNGKEEPTIAAELGVTAYPVFKWYSKGSSEAEPFYYVHYSGRHGHTLMKLVNKRLGREAHEEL